ncbi:MAG: aminotransferase [Acidobacteria bacterium]|nr:aminotransferase [Acidobacteriota bacterium]
MFSSRLPHSLVANALANAVAGVRAAGGSLVDLTVSNPTRVGIYYPPSLLSPLGDPHALSYRPEPFGLRGAREAVAGEYARRGLAVASDRLVLTASTSEAYAFLFKLLCEPGDEILVPRPSYPLFEHLAALEAVRVVPYPLEYHGVWTIDLASLEQARTPRTKAVVVVSPNNPTGSTLKQREAAWLDAFCASHDLALIADEVFADYPIEPAGDASRSVVPGAGSTESPSALTFALGGLSKSVGLPQVKLGWVAVAGPATLVEAALARLELVCDTYLSVSTPVQVALPRLLHDGSVVREAIRERLAVNHAALRRLAADHPESTVLGIEGGWSTVLRVPAVTSEEQLVVDLVERERVLVHPGYFFDFPHEAYLVVSLLPAPDVFREGMTRTFRAVAMLEHTR